MRDPSVSTEGVIAGGQSYQDAVDAVLADLEANTIIDDVPTPQQQRTLNTLARQRWQRKRHDIGLARRILTTLMQRPTDYPGRECGHLDTCGEANAMAHWYMALSFMKPRDRAHAIRYAQSRNHAAEHSAERR